MKQNIILDLCGGTGSWSKPFEDAGFFVFNVDLKNGFDVMKCYVDKDGNLILNGKNERHVFKTEHIFGILAAPPCPMFSFARTNAKEKRDLKRAWQVVQSCLEIIWGCQYKIKSDTQKKPPLKFWALENPNGMLKWFLGKPVFEFNPYDFGDNYKKRTQLWGCFNIPEKNKVSKKYPSLFNILDSKGIASLVKFDKLKTKEIHPEYYGKLTRQERRAITPKGFAKAFFEANHSILD